MAAEEDNFDIDIYGDGEGELGNDGNMDYKQEEDEEELDFIVDHEPSNSAEEPTATADTGVARTTAQEPSQTDVKSETRLPEKDAVPSTKESSAPPPQGTKRKETSDERPIDPGATNALMVSELHWWTTEDDIRGWLNDVHVETELRDLTFSEHKVNGKSKGFVLGFVIPWRYESC